MKTYFVIVIAALFFSFPLFAQQGGDQEKRGTELNLEKIADDMKYKNGVQFIKLNRYEKAIEILNEYLEVYYNGIHRHEAYKNLAEIAFKQFDYQKAANLYKALYEEFSNTSEGVEAHYNIGICYKKMGYNKKAAEVFKDIIVNHPDSDYAYQAKIQVDLLKILSAE